MTNSADPDQLASSDLHCLQRQGISRFSRTRVKLLTKEKTEIFSHTHSVPHTHGVEKSLFFLVSGKSDPISVPMWDKIWDSLYATLTS